MEQLSKKQRSCLRNNTSTKKTALKLLDLGHISVLVATESKRITMFFFRNM